MAIIVLSVPHTGTRFLCTFLDSIGVIYRQYHSEPQCLEDISYETKNRAVIPIRDPLLCFSSTLARGGLENVDNILNNVVTNFELLIQLEGSFNCIYLKVDAPSISEDLAAVHTYVSAPLAMPTEVLKPVGSIASSPTSYNTWKILSKNLGDIKTQEIINALKDVREFYGY